jgi:aldose 1-epimerase
MIAAAHADVKQTLALANGDVSLLLDPEHGGAVRTFRWRGHDVFRPTPHDAGNDPLAYACFPMVPYANRIANGRFTFDDQQIRLKTNWNGDSHPVHGQGWRTSWDIVQATSSSATLALEGGDDEWPWAYRAIQQFDLRHEGMSVTLALTNLSQKPMPAMLGFHPYFPQASKARIGARLPRVWHMRDGWPAAEVETPEPWRFDPPRNAKDIALDHAFSGWDGDADIIWPDRRLHMRATHCPSLHIYTPAHEDFFCAEPQTAAWGALNRGDADVIEPGKTLSITVDFVMDDI